MTNDELEKIRARAAKATPGPWEADHGCAKGYGPDAWATVVAPGGKVLFDTINGGHVLLTDPDYEGEWRDETGDLNATFIAHARTDIPALLDALARAEAHAERLAGALGRSAVVMKRITRARPYGASHIGQVAWENLGEIIDAAEAALSAYNQRTET